MFCSLDVVANREGDSLSAGERRAGLLGVKRCDRDKGKSVFKGTVEEADFEGGENYKSARG